MVNVDINSCPFPFQRAHAIWRNAQLTFPLSGFLPRHNKQQSSNPSSNFGSYTRHAISEVCSLCQFRNKGSFPVSPDKSFSALLWVLPRNRYRYIAKDVPAPFYLDLLHCSEGGLRARIRDFSRSLSSFFFGAFMARPKEGWR